MFTAVYASILAFIMIRLALNVIKTRREHKVRYADGGVLELQIARTAHSNAVDYIPIALILLFLLEYNWGNIWLINLAGISLVTGRIIHARGILSKNLKGRVIGMQFTIWTIIFLAVSNLLYFLYKISSNII